VTGRAIESFSTRAGNWAGSTSAFLGSVLLVVDTDVEFFAKIAHGIRQPLSPMQSALQLLKKCEDTHVREHAHRTIERQIDHMTLERGSRFVVSLPPPMVANHMITSAARLLPQSQR